MRKGSYVFLFGIILVVVPYLGIPSLWKQYIILAIGIMLILLGYAIRRAQYFSDINSNGEFVTDTFVETTPELFK